MVDLITITVNMSLYKEKHKYVSRLHCAVFINHTMQKNDQRRFVRQEISLKEWRVSKTFMLHQAPSHGKHSGAVPPKIFVLPNFIVSRKISFKHLIKTKSFSLKNASFPQTLKPGYRPVLHSYARQLFVLRNRRLITQQTIIPVW